MGDSRLTRIGVFYDGNYFSHVSNYYAYHHPRRARISLSGLHDFIRDRVAASEGCDVKYCHIVDAHYFRGRQRAQEMEPQRLVNERVFEDVLIKEGVVTHFLPLAPGGEKGIDVWLALEAFELAIYKRFDVVVLIAGDGDFVPLVRKLNTMGTRVMLLAWDFQYVDQNGHERETRASQSLIDEATYPLMMHQIIDDRSLRTDPKINALFLPPGDSRPAVVPAEPQEAVAAPDYSSAARTGKIHNLKDAYGFITPDEGGENLFFYRTEVVGVDFNDLCVGQAVTYELGRNDRGPCAVRVRPLQQS
ncbi:MAG: NYN domain-containing protein [Symbiobacterium sp.]|uniref:NYN domain-containing protein n=1 Tax=Symbiobacterium sp. TaxID=1971213 RepID=UPI003464693D